MILCLLGGDVNAVKCKVRLIKNNLIKHAYKAILGTLYAAL
jgi:hypothetical protein